MKPSDQLSMIVVSVVAISVLSSDTTRTTTIFHDSFADGNAEDGVPVAWESERMAPGRYDAIGGDYVLSNGTIMVSTVPEFELADTSIRTRARITGTGSTDDFVGVGVRRGSVFGYAAGLSRTGLLDIIRADPNFRPSPLRRVALTSTPSTRT